MVLTSMSISKSSDVGYAREIPISLKKIIVTESKTVTIPSSYGKSGTSGASSGSANTSSSSKSGSSNSGGSNSNSSSSNSGSQKGGSILYNAASSFGLI